MTVVTKPDMNIGIWASNGNIEQPSSDKVGLGWITEIPLNVQMNWVQNRQDRMLQYLNQRGTPEWDSRTNYPATAHISRGGTIYKAKSQNTDKDPLSNPEIWSIAFTNYEDYVSLFNDVSLIKTQDGYLSQYVQKKSPVMLAECKGVSYLNSNGVSGFAFDQNTPVVLNNGVTTAIFQEVTNNTESSKKVVTMDVLLEVLQQYKVGDLYLTTNATEPNVSLGYGTWERYAEGRAIVGVASPTSEHPEWTKYAGANFGSYTHTLSVAELPPHDHENDIPTYGESGAPNNMIANGQKQDNTRAVWKTKQTGGGEGHNNVQPSIVVYVWRRIA